MVIDSKRFQTTTGVGAPMWHVLMAAGVDPAGEAVPWAKLATRTLNGPQWERFFHTLPGEPRLVVCDQGGEIEGAVRAAWPDARIYYCEHHFFSRHRKLIDALPSGHPVRKTLFKNAFKSVQDWDAFEDAARYEHALCTDPAKPGGTDLSALITSFHPKGKHYPDQIAHREPGDPRSNGAAEATVRSLGHAVPRVVQTA